MIINIAERKLDELQLVSQNNKALKYKFEHSNSGFGYFYFVNHDKEKINNVKIELQGYNYTLFGDYEGLENPNVVIPQSGIAVVPFWTTSTPSKVEFTLCATIHDCQPPMEGFTWDQFALEKTKDVIRKFFSKIFYNKKSGEDGSEAEQDVGCELVLYCLDYGWYYEWVNTSSDYVLEETVAFNLQGAEIRGIEDDAVRVICRPGETKVVQVDLHPNYEKKGPNKRGRIVKSNYKVWKLHNLHF